MQVKLIPYERRVLESLESKFQLEGEIIVGIAFSLEALRASFERVLPTTVRGRSSDRGESRLRGSSTMRTTSSLGASTPSSPRQMGRYGPPVFAGLIETYGACVLITEKPGCAPKFLGDRIKAGQFRAAAERGCPGLGGDIDRLNNIVHPASAKSAEVAGVPGCRCR